MKHIIYIILILFISTTLSAQTQSKRPSWSQGLPERTTAGQPQTPGFKPEPIKPENQSQPDVKTEQPITPDIDIELMTQPDLELNIQPNNTEQPEAAPVRRAGSRRLNNRIVETAAVNPLHEQYSWHLIKTQPINIPPRHVTKNELKVRIFINPEGRVVRVAAGTPDVPAMMLKEAQYSIQQWQFEPPKNIGITDNIAKTFTIEIKTG